MTKPVIKVAGLWKEYTVGHVQTRHTTFYDLLSATLKSPFRALRGRRVQPDEEDKFWALRDVSFEVQPGEVVGIIGRNGAGKSTLLKILSRITAPTKGRIEVRGRLASLLEVGTGFHPELSGRENIFLNGAILGMTRREVARKFDEIVAFAEIEKFVDTPVKRYSSGMYVRLAFAVAAHLEPDILVVDEVLAVGDAEFQKRCLGKMKEVSGGGRTVLFVSHNTNAIQALCSNCVLLDKGRVASVGSTATVIEEYITCIEDGTGFVHADRERLALLDIKATYSVVAEGLCRISIDFEFKTISDIEKLYIDIGMENQNGIRLLQIVPHARGEEPISRPADWAFTYRIEAKLSAFAPGEYFCTVYAHSAKQGVYLHQSNIRLFRVAANEKSQECLSNGFTALLLPKYKTTVQDKGH